MLKFNKIFAIILCITIVMTFSTGCNNDDKVERNQIKTNEIKIEEIRGWIYHCINAQERKNSDGKKIYERQ